MKWQKKSGEEMHGDISSFLGKAVTFDPDIADLDFSKYIYIAGTDSYHTLLLDP